MTFVEMPDAHSMLAPGTGLDAIMPINEALQRAIEKTALDFVD